MGEEAKPGDLYTVEKGGVGDTAAVRRGSCEEDVLKSWPGLLPKAMTVSVFLLQLGVCADICSLSYHQRSIRYPWSGLSQENMWMSEGHAPVGETC